MKIFQPKMSNSTSKTYKFDLLFLRRFFNLHNFFFPRLWSSNSALFGLLLLTSGLEQFLAYETGLLSGLFFKVLGDKDIESFRSACIKSLFIILAMVTTKSLRVYSTKLMTVGWREDLCKSIHKLYLTGISFYRLVMLDNQELDNPDQRITSDCSSITSVYGGIIADLVVVPFTTAYYAYQAYSRAGWLGPTAMFIYFIVSTIINKLLMAPVVNLTAKLEQKEGDFRFKHMEVRSHAESLAFNGSPNTEQEKLNSKLTDVCKVQQSLYTRNLPIDFSVNLFAYLGAIASYLVISVPIFSGQYDGYKPADLAQVISETAFVCIYLVFQLGQLVNITSTVAGLAGSTHRVAELVEKLNEYKKESYETKDEVPDVVISNGSETEDISTGLLVQEENFPSTTVTSNNENLTKTGNTEFFHLKDVSFTAPGMDTKLVQDLSISLTENTNLLIMGHSGSGKSSLLRVLRGLWNYSGLLLVDKSQEVIFLPQTPFFTNGSLREQVVYPHATMAVDVSESHLLDLLDLCDLTPLVARCGGLEGDMVTNWYTELSPGEQQRVAWVRLIYHQPRLALLDEATSAVSEELEYLMYKGAIERGITLVSVGHRGSLRQFHQKVLCLEREGRWRVQGVESYRSQQSLMAATEEKN